MLLIIVAADKIHRTEENVGLARKTKSGDQTPEMIDSDVRTCLTFDRHAGVCLPISECYPYTKMHKSIDNRESWVIGTRGTCNYVEPSGKQVKSSASVWPIISFPPPRIKFKKKNIYLENRLYYYEKRFRLSPECFVFILREKLLAWQKHSDTDTLELICFILFIFKI